MHFPANCDIGATKSEFRSSFGNLGLKSGYANLQIGGLHHAILENGVPGIAAKQS